MNSLFIFTLLDKQIICKALYKSLSPLLFTKFYFLLFSTVYKSYSIIIMKRKAKKYFNMIGTSKWFYFLLLKLTISCWFLEKLAIIQLISSIIRFVRCMYLNRQVRLYLPIYVYTYLRFTIDIFFMNEVTK